MPSPSPAINTSELRRARPLLGTLVEIRAAAPWPAPRLHAALDAAFAAVERVQGLMSFHDAASELSMLNREAWRRSMPVSAETWDVLAEALELSRLSGGAFDISVAPSLEAWGYLPAAAAPVVPGADWNDIELLPGERVRYTRPLRIDLGGIAKGHAVDRAIEVLRRAGVDSAVVNAGGDLRVFGAAQPVHLRHPLDPVASGHELQLRDEALATSAAYFSRRRIDALEVSPLLDPRSRSPYVGTGSVSVCAPDCRSADALTKVVLFAPPELAQAVLAGRGARAWVQQPLEAAA
jgi:thiamine biosynthesis lipoprotein